MYRVFKFGGASIRDIEQIKNVGRILLAFNEENLVVVFSAMGKVTNMLEDVVDSYIKRTDVCISKLNKVKDFHLFILEGLFDKDHDIYNKINNLFLEIEWVLEVDPNEDSAYYYDQIVSVGEFLSTEIMSAYLLKIGFDNIWYDARDLIRTDNTYRNAKVDWGQTTMFIDSQIKDKHCITQGFLGCTSENFTTTLGREGSDFSAAILAFSLNAKELVIWKDVPGLMNADPAYFEDAELLERVSFDEAIELAYFGAKVIHPKTIQPLKKKSIPLRIKSFLNPTANGSRIIDEGAVKKEIPSYIIKKDQILISISDASLAFIIETHMSQIFSLLAFYAVEVNMMQNSAVSFSICVDNDKYKIPKLIQDLKDQFNVFYNDELTLYTVRNYTSKSLYNLVGDKEILLEQRTRNTFQVVLRDI
tara:strand:+ start:1722 stop:2975 length:1254 start_codon:yes stop_codon:yes gene_type:complete